MLILAEELGYLRRIQCASISDMISSLFFSLIVLLHKSYDLGPVSMFLPCIWFNYSL